MSLNKPVYKFKKIIIDNMDKIVYKNLSLNPNAINFLKDNPKLINWECLCQNTNPSVIDLFNDNIDKIKWYFIVQNENLYELMRHLPEYDLKYY